MRKHQEYLDKPLLLDPAETKVENFLRILGPRRLVQVRLESTRLTLFTIKFHLRVYCVASGALTLFVHENMLGLFAGALYGAPSRPKDDDDHVSRVLISPIHPGKTLLLIIRIRIITCGLSRR